MPTAGGKRPGCALRTLASERAWPRGLLETAGRLKERHVGFCAMLSGGAAAAASAEAVAQAPVQAHVVEEATARILGDAAASLDSTARESSDLRAFVQPSSPGGGLVDNLAPLVMRTGARCLLSSDAPKVYVQLPEVCEYTLRHLK